MKQLLLFFGACLLAGFLPAQKIVAEKSFGVNYPISSIGYPSKVVPNANGGFAYIEYWTPGEGRKFAGKYIQSYNKAFEEEWFRPVTGQEVAPLKEITDLVRFENAFGVIGYQYSPAVKRDQVKMQLFSLDGQPVGGLNVVSTYSKKDKDDFVDVFSMSGDRSKLLWLGHNPSASAGKRAFMANVWTEQGQKLWSKSLYMPHVAEEKYLVTQAEVDKRGNAYFLLEYEEKTNGPKDTLHRPYIVRYDHKENKYTDHQLHFPNASIPAGRIHLTERGELAFVGILSDGSGGGFLNGSKRYETALSWDNLVFQLFDIERELLLKNEYKMAFPEAMLQRYKERGADFAESRVLERNGKLYWLMEEQYVKEQGGEALYFYYDVATIAIDRESGEIMWANSFEKKQRDYKSGNVLSYCVGISRGALRFVYLNERGAQGKILCTSLDLRDGSSAVKTLALNEKANYLFFPGRSAMVDEDRMVLMGIGNPVGNDYKLMEVSFAE